MRDNKEIAFGMTKDIFAQAAAGLSKSDANYPLVYGSYEKFFDTVKAGHIALLSQKGYGKINIDTRSKERVAAAPAACQ